MADQPAPPETPDKPAEERKYILKFEPVGEFSETELFVKGCVRGKIWISDQTPLLMKSLTGEETDKVDEAVRVKPGMSQREYNTQTTYYNLAYSIEAIGDKKLDGPIEDRVKQIRAMAAPVLGRMSLAILEFGIHVDELFVGKGGLELAKKS